jgi:hypothetical protein
MTRIFQPFSWMHCCNAASLLLEYERGVVAVDEDTPGPAGAGGLPHEDRARVAVEMAAIITRTRLTFLR